MPKISIILPVFNCEKYAGAAIESILNQTFTDYEFIILNDGSTDNSFSIIKSYDDPRIRIINKSNSGYIDTLNYGIKLSNGDIIARMDSDDIALPNRLLLQLRAFRRDTAVLGGQINLMDRGGKLRKGPVFPTEHDIILKRLTKGESALVHPSTLINKELILKAGCYDVRMAAADDIDLWLRLSKLGRLENIKNIVLNLRKHDNNISVIMSDKQLLNALITINYFKRHGNYGKISEDEYNELSEKIEGKINSNLYFIKNNTFLQLKKVAQSGNSFHQIQYIISNPSFIRLYFEIIKIRKLLIKETF